MKTMKLRFKKPFRVLMGALLPAIAMLALSTAQMTASDNKSVAASVLNKLDEHLVLVVKKSRREPPFDRETTLQPDVYKFNGRVLVEIEGAASRELFGQIASLGGQVVPG